MSDVNWWLMVLSFLLGALITWLWSVRRVSREVPRTVLDRDRNLVGSAGATVAGVGAGVAGAAAGAAALGNRDKDVDLDGDFDATTRRADLDVDRPSAEVYDRTADESVSTTWDAPDANAPSVDVPEVDRPSFESQELDDAELDSPTVQRSSLELPDPGAPTVDAPEIEVPEASARDVESPGVAGGAAGAAAAGAAGLGAASWSSRAGEADDVTTSAASEPVRFAGAADTAGTPEADDATDAGTADVDTADVDTARLDSQDVAASSDAEILEAESGLETPAAPTGEADWSTATGADSDLDAEVDSGLDSGLPSGLDSGLDSGPTAEASPLDTAPTSGPTTSVMSSHDAGDLAAAKEPVTGTSADATADTGASTGTGTSTSTAADAGTSSTGGSATGAAGLAGSGAAGAPVTTGKFGKGSAEPNSDGSGPSGWAIKGNEDSMLFHTQDSPSYKRTRAEVWFEDEDSARKAGFTKWNEKNRSGAGGGAAKLVAIPEGKFGKGSADPGADGSGPEGWTVKGNEDSNLFHTQDSPYFGRTKAEVWFDSEDAARGAGFIRWDEKDRSGRAGGASALVEIPDGRFGKGSADPGDDGSGPDGWAIKGNENSMLFHTRDSPAYGRTKAEVWFQDEESARRAGFTKWNERNR